MCQKRTVEPMTRYVPLMGRESQESGLLLQDHQSDSSTMNSRHSRGRIPDPHRTLEPSCS